MIKKHLCSLLEAKFQAVLDKPIRFERYEVHRNKSGQFLMSLVLFNKFLFFKRKVVIMIISQKNGWGFFMKNGNISKSEIFEIMKIIWQNEELLNYLTYNTELTDSGYNL